MRIDPALRRLRFPTMALLTLVENAVRHGIDPSRRTVYVGSAARLDGAIDHAVGAGRRRGFVGHGRAGGTGLTNLRDTRCGPSRSRRPPGPARSRAARAARRDRPAGAGALRAMTTEPKPRARSSPTTNRCCAGLRSHLAATVAELAVIVARRATAAKTVELFDTLPQVVFLDMHAGLGDGIEA